MAAGRAAGAIMAATAAPSALALTAMLSLAAAVPLGITRFVYGLLLPPMRTDLNWSHTLTGAINTVNALGYLLGALATSWLVRRFNAGRVMI